MTECGNHCDLFIGWVNPQIADMPGVCQTDMLPILAAVGGTVHTIPIGNIPALLDLASTHPDHIRITGRDRQGPDRCAALLVKQRLPG